MKPTNAIALGQSSSALFRVSLLSIVLSYIGIVIVVLFSEDARGHVGIPGSFVLGFVYAFDVALCVSPLILLALITWLSVRRTPESASSNFRKPNVSTSLWWFANAVFTALAGAIARWGPELKSKLMISILF